jgi:AmpE protein
MTLLSMLIALIIERLAVRGAPWQWVSYFRPYLRASEQGVLAQWSTRPWLAFVWWLLPALMVALCVHLVQFWLFQLALNVVVLLLCIGCWHYRQRYKQYLNALTRDDKEAAFLLMEQVCAEQGCVELASDTAAGASQWVWLNFRYYAAVLFWFMLLGAFGAVAYASLRQLSEPLTGQQSDDDASREVSAQSAAASAEPQAALVMDDAGMVSGVEANSGHGSSAAIYGSWQQQAQVWLHWADFLPARLFGLGLALVGDFNRTSALFMQQVGDLTMPASQFYSQLSLVAEPMFQPVDSNAADSQQLTRQTVAAVQLAKRNVLFFLALVAILTLSGWLA